MMLQAKTEVYLGYYLKKTEKGEGNKFQFMTPY